MATSRSKKIVSIPAPKPITIEDIEHDLRASFEIVRDELIQVSEYIANDAAKLVNKLKHNPKCHVIKRGEFQGLGDRHLGLCAEYSTYFTVLEMFDKLKEQESSDG